MTEVTAPFCKDCAYFLRASIDPENSMCGHPQYKKVCLVTGETSSDYFCVTLRGPTGPCGPEGKLFLAKFKPQKQMPESEVDGGFY